MLQSSSSSSSSSTSNYSFTSSPSSLNSNKNNNKTMEEVWKDITINSLPTTPIHHIHNIHHPTPNSHFTTNRSSIILQDFLHNEAETRANNTPSSMESSSTTSHSTIPSTIKPPTTEFQFFDNEMMNTDTPHHQQFHHNSSCVVHNLIGLNDGVAAFDALANSSVLTSFGNNNNNGGSNAKKRVSDGDDDHGCVDRRHKRMIKNRESAARSRARKQAYITELELEVDQLTKENKRLRKQQRQLIEAPTTMLPKKHGLHRTSTAPF